MKKIKVSELPTIIYVKKELDGDAEYFVADADMDQLVENESTLIGQYQLVQKGKWKLKVTPI